MKAKKAHKTPQIHTGTPLNKETTKGGLKLEEAMADMVPGTP